MSAQAIEPKRRLCTATVVLHRPVPPVWDRLVLETVLDKAEARRCVRGDEHSHDEHRTIGLDGEDLTFRSRP